MLMQHIETNLIGSLLWLIYKQQFFSSCGHQLQVVWLNCRTVTRSRAFHASAPKEWNQLPLSLLSSYALLPSKSGSKLFGFQGSGKVMTPFTWCLTIRTSEASLQSCLFYIANCRLQRQVPSLY